MILLRLDRAYILVRPEKQILKNKSRCLKWDMGTSTFAIERVVDTFFKEKRREEG